MTMVTVLNVKQRLQVILAILKQMYNGVTIFLNYYIL